MKYIFEFDGDIGTEGTIHYQVVESAEENARYKEFGEQIAMLCNKRDELKRQLQFQQNVNERLRGEIDGLRFAIRCDGVSGAEVHE